MLTESARRSALYAILILFLNQSMMSSFLSPQSIRIASSRTSSCLLMMSGYIPPEEDEEYRGSVQKSRQRAPKIKDINGEIINGQQLLPLPAEGDIVLCPGKYKNERVLARIRFLEYISSNKNWIADLSPLKEGKSIDIFTLDSQAKSTSAKISDLTPVRAFFKRSENGYQVKYKMNSTEFIVRAPSYREMPANFSVPVKVINCFPTPRAFWTKNVPHCQLIHSTEALLLRSAFFLILSIVFDIAQLRHVCLVHQSINATVLEDDLDKYEELKKR